MTEERIDAAVPEHDGSIGGGGGEDIDALRAELEETRAQFMRARADYQNLERRSQEERREFGRYQLTSLVLNFLPVLDDLERALELAGDASDAWLEGVRLVEQKFRGVLEAAGVTEIEALGLPFDPKRHEAVTAAPGPEGRVVQVTRRGYVLQERVIRPASVVVGSGEASGT
jgi:molecular chaperone GrpE